MRLNTGIRASLGALRRTPMGTLLVLAAVAGCSGSSSATAPTPTRAVSPTAAPTRGYPAIPKGSAFVATLITDVGGLKDKSFNQLTWQGLKAAHRKYGITIKAVESRKQSQYLHNLVRAAQHYSTLTIAIGYGMGAAVYTAAIEFPKARFAVIDGRPLDATGHEVILPNVVNLLFREQESGYAVGVIAGLMEKQHVGRATHNTIGYLGGQDIAPVNDYLAGYVAGAHSVDPSVRVLREYAQTFSNSTLGAQIATQQIGKGADVLFQVAAQTGVGYLSVVQKHGLYGIGADTDQRSLGSSIITSAVKKPSIAILAEVGTTVYGRFRGGDRRLGAAQSAVGFAVVSAAVPAGVAAKAAGALRSIAAGAVTPPTSIPGR